MRIPFMSDSGNTESASTGWQAGRTGRHAWVVSFGPVGSGADGYLVRAEATARTLKSLDFDVAVLEISRRSGSVLLEEGIRIHPAWPRVVPARLVLGSVDWAAEFRTQLALLAGVIRYRHDLRGAQVVVIEGGLLTAAGLIRLLRRPRASRPRFILDAITVMSALHRHHVKAGREVRDCSITCRLRRFAWRVIEVVASRSTDLTVVCSPEDALHFKAPVAVVRHGLLRHEAQAEPCDQPNTLAFLGGGQLAPNREAVEFIVRCVLDAPSLHDVRCQVIGDQRGYMTRHERLEFVGFSEQLSKALAHVSVCCAPMAEAGGVSTNVLTSLVMGKRTVCSPEAAQG